MILIDTNIFMYAAGAKHPYKEPSVRFLGPAELILMVERAEAVHSEEVAVSESARKRFRDLADELATDPRSFRELSPEERKARLQRVMGIGRGLFSSSEEFACRKEEEIELEERHLGRSGQARYDLDSLPGDK